MSTLAGSATAGAADGMGALASFKNPANVAVLPSGDLLVADFDNGAIRQVTPGGDVTTVIPSGTLPSPFGLLVTELGEVYVQTDGNSAGMVTRTTGSIWRIDIPMQIATLIIENIGRPRGMASLSDGNILLSDPAHHTLSVLDPEMPMVNVFAGEYDVLGCEDGMGTAARFNQPYGLGRLSNGDYVVADQASHRIRRITVTGEVSTFAGEPAPGLVDGMALTARFNYPQDVVVDANDNVYVSDLGNQRIRRIDANGLVTTLAGSGMKGFADGSHDMAQFFGQEGIEVGGTTLYVADGNGGMSVEPFHRIRMIPLP